MEWFEVGGGDLDAGTAEEVEGDAEGGAAVGGALDLACQATEVASPHPDGCAAPEGCGWPRGLEGDGGVGGVEHETQLVDLFIRDACCLTLAGILEDGEHVGVAEDVGKVGLVGTDEDRAGYDHDFDPLLAVAPLSHLGLEGYVGLESGLIDTFGGLLFTTCFCLHRNPESRACVALVGHRGATCFRLLFREILLHYSDCCFLW